MDFSGLLEAALGAEDVGMIKIAIVGTGGMANMHAESFKSQDNVKVVAGCDIDEGRANTFVAKHGIEKAYTDFGRMLNESGCDAVAVVTPDATHAALSIQALNAGKHVFCEKPLATSADDANKMVTVAKETGLINMVNLTYRNSAAWQELLQMTQSGELGTIRHVQAHYLQSWLTTKDWGDWKTSPGWLWRLSCAHGSKGALGDIGVHILDFATMPVGPVSSLYCRLKTFEKAPDNRIGEYTLDANDSAMINLEFTNGALGSVAVTRFATGHKNSLLLTVYGDKAAVRLDLDASYSLMEICRIGADGCNQPWERIYCAKTPNNYVRFVESIRSGVNDQPDFARGAEVQKMLDACELSDANKMPVSLA